MKFQFSLFILNIWNLEYELSVIKAEWQCSTTNHTILVLLVFLIPMAQLFLCCYPNCPSAIFRWYLQSYFVHIMISSAYQVGLYHAIILPLIFTPWWHENLITAFHESGIYITCFSLITGGTFQRLFMISYLDEEILVRFFNTYSDINVVST